MKKVLQSPWTALVVGCLLYLLTTAGALHPSFVARARTAAEPPKLSPSNDPSWRFHNPEFEQWLEELSEEKKAVASKQKELADLQLRLQAERQEIWAATQTVYQLQKEFDRAVTRFKDQETENLKHQLKLISGMSSEGAAAMLVEMPEEEMVRIVFTLKPDQAAEVLDALTKMGKNEARLAAKIAEKIRTALPPESTKPAPRGQ